MTHELAERNDAGILVRLLWHSADGTVRVEYHDTRTGDEFSARVPSAKALEAFLHPNVYRDDAARRERARS